MSSVLVVVCGLPATGKSTVATSLAAQRKVPYLRVDRIEQAIVSWSSLVHPVGAVGYAVAHQIAAEQLALGLDVIVECVNPITITRDSWAATARATDADLVEVELVCSDALVHQSRVETRMSDVEGLIKPTWRDVLERTYEPWNRPHLTLDTATLSAAEVVALVAAEIESIGRRSPA